MQYSTKIANNEKEITDRVALNKSNNAKAYSKDSCFTNLFENLVLFGIYPLNIIKAGIAIAIVGSQPRDMLRITTVQPMVVIIPEAMPIVIPYGMLFWQTTILPLLPNGKESYLPNK